MSPIEYVLHHNRTGDTDLTGQVILMTEDYNIGQNVYLNPIVPAIKNAGLPYHPVICEIGRRFHLKITKKRIT